ncbi:uncharacterized protein ZK688.7-like [Atheta coriaria]|uniref:uncharacterized protein ZK688.7-like n=1 Tax=Dalotia coriaria TaxID=877792 RepID=UPI0031F3B145
MNKSAPEKSVGSSAATGMLRSGSHLNKHLPQVVSSTTSKMVKSAAGASKVMLIPAIASDVYSVYGAVSTDYENSTSRNTVETVAGVAGGWGGAAGGGSAGALIGSAVLPGVGTVAGGLAGAIVGGIGGLYGASATTELVSDMAGYDMEERCCKKCGYKFTVRLYQSSDSKQVYCPDCR